MAKSIEELIAEFEKVCEARKHLREVLKKDLTQSVVDKAEEKMKESAGGDDFKANLKSYMTVRTNYDNAISAATGLESQYHNLKQLIFSEWRIKKDH